MKFKIVIVTAPLFGKPKEREVEVELTADGVSLADILAKAGVPVGNNQISVNGEPVSDQNLHVKDGARIELLKGKKAEQRPARVEVTERASGS
jgi:sulfur carrier protein ThiS